MAYEKEIIFESNRGIIFERTLLNNGRIRLAVINKRNGETMSDYLYKNMPGLQAPFLNLDNLNCVNGWIYDETYLHMAVQNGKKLYAGFTFSIARKGAFTGQHLPQGFYTEAKVKPHKKHIWE